MKVKYLEKSDKKSHKFYELIFDNFQVTVKYGRIGSNGKFISRVFNGKNDAKLFFELMLSKKLKKGYTFSEKGKTLPKVKLTHPGQLLLPFNIKF